MKRMNVKIIGMAALTFALAACNSDENLSAGNDDRVALQVTSGIQSRAIGNTWQKDDAIGIYMVNAGTTAIAESAENRKYTTANGSSTFSATPDQVIYLPVDGSNVDFIAYYPQQDLTGGSMTIDVSDQSDLPKIDLMAAKAKSPADKPYNKENPLVAFHFYHKLTKLELNIDPGTGLTPADLEGLKVEITNQRTGASYAPLAETLTLTSSETTQNVTLNITTDGTAAEAILLPNSEEFNPRIAGRELVFTLKQTGEVFRWAIPEDKDFKAGERNLYNITVNRTGLTVTATIEDWNPGNGEGESGSAE